MKNNKPSMLQNITKAKGKFKPEEPTSHQHSFSDAQNVIIPSVKTAKNCSHYEIGKK